ncbi:hypothetical protein T459_18937 [Capsicum annuum]|uniref:S-protein homolog n=1 Tax=Capsicum annuum TaxID=4072 RepID=A0A2G2Z0L5_CAPAN|nr:hypothetical protein T459_18937 [Capsicum annuum]
MSFIKHKFIFFSFIFVLNLLMVKGSWTPRYQVHINNNLPDGSNPLRLRCKSKDDDLGDKVRSVNEEFTFAFNEHVLGETLFFCHFYWNSKDKSFDVFNDTMADKCGLERKYGLNFYYGCYWKVQEDGFYFDSQLLPTPEAQYEKFYEW